MPYLDNPPQNVFLGLGPPGVTGSSSSPVNTSGTITSTNAANATTSLTGAIVQNGGSAATSVGIGQGNINAGGTLTVGSTVYIAAGTIVGPAGSVSVSGTTNAVLGLNANTGNSAIYRYYVNSAQVYQTAGSATSWSLTDSANAWNPFVYTAGAVGAGFVTFPGTPAANAAATTGSVVFSGGVAAAGAFQSQLGFGVGALPTATTPINVSVSQNTGTEMQVANPNAGGAASANYWATNGTSTVQFGKLGTAYTTSGVLVANTGIVYDGGAAGLAIVAASGTIVFATGGTASRGGIASTGVWTLGPTSNPAANTFAPPIIYGRNNAAADNAGAVGEVIQSQVASVAAGATTVAANITSISLTAGKWEITGSCTWNEGATGLTTGGNVDLTIGTTSATNGTQGSTMSQSTVQSIQAAGFFFLAAPTQIVNISATTTYFLVGQIPYAAGSPTASASLVAVRLP